MPPVVETLVLGPFAENCHLVRAERGAPEAVVVDPGDDAAEIRLRLAGMGARCAAILLTHGHVDHVGAVADLAEGTGCPVYMPVLERAKLEDAERTQPAGFGIRSWAPDVLLEGGEEIEVGGITFQVDFVPGHSAGHISFHADGALFSGDVLFAGGVGRTDLDGGDWDTLLASIARLVDAYAPETIVYPGHGPSTTLGAELAHNPFLAELRAADQT